MSGLDCSLAREAEMSGLAREGLKGRGGEGGCGKHLVVSLAGGTVANGIGANLLGDLDLPLGNQGPGDGRAEEVGALVQGVGPRE